jgi:hypothetical protein
MSTPGIGFARRVTVDTIARFRGLLRGSRTLAFLIRRSRRRQKEIRQAESEFAGTPVNCPSPFTRSLTAPSVAAPPPVEKKNKSSHPSSLGAILWAKKLTKTDAQRQVGNPTGDIRLTAAAFKVDGKIVDQTTYFRQVVFVNSEWLTEHTGPFVEVASIVFRVWIANTNYGEVNLLVSHKPSGEAGQGNYTTGIRWGSLMPLLRSTHDITGMSLRLYAPAGAATDPFSIVVG